MKELGILLCLISGIIHIGIILKFMFEISLICGLIISALILELLGICLIDAEE